MFFIRIFIFSIFFFSGLVSHAFAQTDRKMEFNANSVSLECTTSSVGGVDTCSQRIRASVYFVPRIDGGKVTFTCYVTWNYYVKDSKTWLKKEFEVQQDAILDAHSAKADLVVEAQLKTVNQAQPPSFSYNCEVRY